MIQDQSSWQSLLTIYVFNIDLGVKDVLGTLDHGWQVISCRFYWPLGLIIILLNVSILIDYIKFQVICLFYLLLLPWVLFFYPTLSLPSILGDELPLLYISDHLWMTHPTEMVVRPQNTEVFNAVWCIVMNQRWPRRQQATHVELQTCLFEIGLTWDHMWEADSPCLFVTITRQMLAPHVSKDIFPVVSRLHTLTQPLK